MKIKTVIGISAALVIAAVSQAGAHMGRGYGWCNGPMMGGMMYNGSAGPMMDRAAAALTPEEQARVDKIRAAYEDRLAAGEKAIRAKIAEIDKAAAGKDTTVAQLTALRRELYDLKRDYWRTRREFNLEVADALGREYYGAGGWGPQYCAMNRMGMGPCPGRAHGPWCW